MPSASSSQAEYGQLPLRFEINEGQTAAQVNFLARGPGYALFLTPGETVLSLQANGGSATAVVVADVLSMELVGGNPNPGVAGLDELEGKSNYFSGNNPSHWHTNVANYGRVVYTAIYPGINLVYYGNQRNLEYDFQVAAGADPGPIRLRFAGAQGMELDGQGNLVLHTAGGEVVEQAPLVYQQRRGVRQPVAGHFVLEKDSQVGFAVGAYDHSKMLIIDPVLSYSTYLGGSGADGANGIAVDQAGDAYVTGLTQSSNFPTVNPLQPANAGQVDAFVAKLNPTGSALIYSTYLGGSNVDEANGIAIDPAGNAYVTGYTDSIDFPTVNALQPANADGYLDAFVAKLNPTGSALIYSTYLGGSRHDVGQSIAADADGNAYVTGTTSSADFPMVNPLQPALGGLTDAFVAKLNADGSALIYSTYLGGSGYDQGNGIAVDAAGNAYVIGSTWSTDFPTANAFQPANGGGSNYDAFVAKLNIDGSELVYSTYLGGSNYEQGYGIAVDQAGNAYVTGLTASSNFPTANPLQPANAGGFDVFAAKLNAAGSALVYSTYLGGSSTDVANGIAVDTAGNAYITGYTWSTNFPTANPVQPSNGGYNDGFCGEVERGRVGAGLLHVRGR